MGVAPSFFITPHYLGPQLQGNFGIFWIAYLLTQLTAIGVAFTFAALCPTIDFANGAVPSFAGWLVFPAYFLERLSSLF